MNIAHYTLANRFIDIMKRAGGVCFLRTAGTGTVYVTINDIYKVRFADHGECYCRENISVDPDGCTLEQAVRAAGRACDLDVTRSLAAFKAAATRARNNQKARRAALAPALEQARMQEESRKRFQAKFIKDHHPEYATLSTKSRKRIRAKANKLFEAQND